MICKTEKKHLLYDFEFEISNISTRLNFHIVSSNVVQFFMRKVGKIIAFIQVDHIKTRSTKKFLLIIWIAFGVLFCIST